MAAKKTNSNGKKPTDSKSSAYLSKKRPVAARGRIFKGKVVKKFPKRIVIELDRTVFIPKYERFLKKTTRIHARLEDKDFNNVHIGDIVKVQETRPLSKIIHFIFTEKISSAEETK